MHYAAIVVYEMLEFSLETLCEKTNDYTIFGKEKWKKRNKRNVLKNLTINHFYDKKKIEKRN